MNKTYLFSLVIPAFNAEQTLESCLNSIIKQNEASYEVIIINDGSTDNTDSICEKYAKQYTQIKTISQDNQGVSSARNRGIEEAQGKYIVFVDSDDQIDEHYFYKIRNALKIYGDEYFIIYGIVKECMGKSSKLQYADEEISILSSDRFLQINKSFLFNPIYNKLYLRKKLNDNNIRFSIKFSVGEDMLFNIEYLFHSDVKKFLILNQVVYHYINQNENSLSKKYIPRYFEDHMYFMDRMWDLVKQYKVPENDFHVLKGIMWRYFELSMENTMRKENRSNFFEKIKYNSNIMKHEKFSGLLNENRKRLPRRLYYAYKTKNYYIVYMMKKLKKD